MVLLALGAILFAVALIFSAASLRQVLTNTPPVVRIVIFCASCALDVFVGFVTARSASHAKKFHALIVGILLILISFTGLIVSMRDDSANIALAVLRVFLILPLVLYGANLEMKND